jgi:prepilin-type N-terminal cleavage/methylation domain-containing protein
MTLKVPLKDIFTNDQGFTLMEVLIAITILSFIMVSIITIQDNGIATKERVILEDRDWLQVETAFSRLEWDFSQIHSPLYYSHEMRPSPNPTEQEQEVYSMLTAPYMNNDNFAFPSFDGHPVPIFKLEDKNTLTFFTTSNRRKYKNIKQSNFAWVRFKLEKLDANQEDNNDSPKDTMALVRYFYPDNPFSNEVIPWEDLKGQVLLRNIVDIKFEMWDRELRKWQENMDVIKDGAHKIQGLKVTLNWMDKDENKYQFVRIFRPLQPHFEPEDMYKLKLNDSTTLPNSDNSSNFIN